METVTISKEEYEKLKKMAEKVKIIDQTIHEDITYDDLMRLQEKGHSFDFLKEEPEIYSESDVKEKWKKEI